MPRRLLRRLTSSAPLHSLTAGVIFCTLLLSPVSAYAQDDGCDEDLGVGSRVRLTVHEHQWSKVSQTVKDCTPSALVVVDEHDNETRLPWDSIDRLEGVRQWDLRWPGLAAGIAGGVWLGLNVPLEEDRPCDVVTSYDGWPTYDCPISDQVQGMFAGLSIGMIAGYFGGMLIKFDRWEVLPTYSGNQRALALRISF